MAPKHLTVMLTGRQWASLADVPPPKPEAWRWVDSRDLAEAISLLDPRLERAIRLSLSGASVSEIARRVNATGGHVLARILRGRGRLRELLRERLPPHVREQVAIRRR